MSQAPSPSEQKQRVQETFNRMAAGYDALRFVQVCARRLLELAELREGMKVLDVATGTGLVAGVAAQIVGPSGSVVGMDLSSQMLVQARQKFGGVSNLEFRQGDAERLEFPDASFDAVLCASSLFFIPDMLAVVRECRRVLKNGGRVGFSSFGSGFLQPLNDLWAVRMERYGIARGPLPTVRLVDPHACRDLLSQAGFEAIEVYSEQCGYYLPDVEARWAEIMAGLEGQSLAQLTPEEREKLKAEHLEELRPLVTPDGIWVDVSANFAFGRKPGAA